MKLKLVGLGVTLAMVAASSMGCSPAAAQAPAAGPTDVVAAMEAELAHTLAGTTTLTSAEMALPTSRMPVAQWNDANEEIPSSREAEAPTAQTWGVAPAPLPIDTENPYK